MRTGSLRRLQKSLLFLGLAVAYHTVLGDTITNRFQPTIGSPESWICPLFFDRTSKAFKPDPSQDQRWLLIDRQISAEDNTFFIHEARQILTVSGVQNGSTLSVDFAPKCQKLALHWIRIWRGTNWQDRLDRDKIKLIQPEHKLDDYIFAGRQSAVLILEDVRVGDIVDYAYSIKGENPVFQGKFSAEWPVQWSRPVERLVTRLIWPSDKRLFVKNHGCSVQPIIKKTAKYHEYIWDVKGIRGLRVEDSLPGWYNPQPWIQLSEVQTWKEVNEWALEMFHDTSPLSAALTQKIQEWRRITDREKQVMEALRFVQEEVRYFAISIGVSTHQPAASSVVFERRFGDCKDKVLLLVTVLRALGVEAYPVLVNTQCRQTIDAWLPTPLAFDHVIAQIRLGKRIYWVDATTVYQRGPLAARYTPDYRRGLVVEPRTTALTEIPRSGGLPETIITEYFQLGDLMNPTDLEVVTVAMGADADHLRAQLAATPRAEIENDHLHYYSRLYPGIRRTRTEAISDDEQQNRIQITEAYTIDRMWVHSDTDGNNRCEFYPYRIASLLARPADVTRAMPLGREHPKHYILRTEVEMPFSLSAWAENKPVSDPAFEFRMNLQRASAHLEIEYEFRSLTDFVPANRVTDYVQQMSTASQSLGYHLSWNYGLDGR